jgi:hypothetical protein
MNRPESTRSIPDLPDPPRKGFAAIPNQLLADRLGPTAVNVYAVLAMHADAKGNAWPKVATIARLVRLTENSVRVALRLLVKRRWITPHYRDGMSTVYHIRRAIVTDTPPPIMGLSPETDEQEPYKRAIQNVRKTPCELPAIRP